MLPDMPEWNKVSNPINMKTLISLNMVSDTKTYYMLSLWLSWDMTSPFLSNHMSSATQMKIGEQNGTTRCHATSTPYLHLWWCPYLWYLSTYHPYPMKVLVFLQTGKSAKCIGMCYSSPCQLRYDHIRNCGVMFHFINTHCFTDAAPCGIWKHKTSNVIYQVGEK